MNDIDEELDDIFSGEAQETQEVNQQEDNKIEDIFEETKPYSEQPSQQDDLVIDLLNSIGIKDGKVSIIDESGNASEIDFNSLSKEEKLSILNPQVEPAQRVSEDDLDDSEIELLNQIRERGQTVNEFLEEYKQSVLTELGLNSSQYSIDAYTDQELYALDLKNKFDLSDEEIVSELQKEMQNEELFTKKVNALRTEYKTLEDQYNEAREQEFQRQQEQEFSEFSEQMTNVAVDTTELHGIEIEDDEKNRVLSFLLDIDENGTSEFHRALSDPKKLFEAAWFMCYGKESFDLIKNAYETEMAKLKKPDRQVYTRQTETKENP